MGKIKLKVGDWVKKNPKFAAYHHELFTGQIIDIQEDLCYESQVKIKITTYPDYLDSGWLALDNQTQNIKTVKKYLKID